MSAPSRAAIEAILHEGVPLARLWGVEVLAAAEGRATLRLPRRGDLLRPGNTVSGPALMGLADMAVWAALLSVTGGKDESVTSTLTANFLRPVGPGPALAEARLVKRGRRMVFAEVLLRAEGSEEIAMHVTSTWAVIAPAREKAHG
ncbi:PaaI family thioesterase [Crenalkalicoccus roseus]|uniref:PaaI family thioesterase n=1 Tax=Crenalkalicoccus roseus TaxID=1485588 RepID=UPI0010819561|nr:PaaI family thioesterase [Crenalkalicoccus roseus]